MAGKQSSSAFIISIIFLLFTIIVSIIFIISYVTWAPFNEGTSCRSNGACLPTEICSQNKCQGIDCETDTDCGTSAICVNSRCYLSNCVIGNDCPDRTACVNGLCLPLGTACVSNSDCGSLSCLNDICVQCSSDSSCEIGQYCAGGACLYPYANITGANLINFPSPSQDRGNVIAPPGYFCPVASITNTPICGNDIGEPINCGSASSC